MPENVLPEYQWTVAFRDTSRFTVRAAYVQEGIAQPQITTISTTRGNPAPPVLVLKDADHKPVLAAPLDQVVYFQRGAQA